MAPKYKLTYFKVKALGEAIRLLLTYGNIEFEDELIEFDKWPEFKKTTPYGRLPLLEVDGKKFNQSAAICRYIGKQIGLCGKNDWEDLQIDMLADTYLDVFNQNGDYFRETDEARKAEKKRILINESMPFYLSKFDEQVKKNGGHFVGGKFTWVDFYIVLPLESMGVTLKGAPETLEEYPNLKALKQKILEVPSIKAYLSKRPAMMF